MVFAFNFRVDVSQTGKSLRIAELKLSFIKGKTDSNYSEHLESLDINTLKYSGILLKDQIDLSSAPLLNIFRRNLAVIFLVNVLSKWFTDYDVTLFPISHTKICKSFN